MEEKITNKLVEIQKQIPVIGYDSEVKFKGVQFKYASLPEIHKIVKPILNKAGAYLSYEVTKDSIICKIVFSEINDLTKTLGIISNEIAFAPATDPKQTGSLITYYKRYLLSALLALDTEEDKDIAPMKEKKKVDLTQKAYEQAQARIAKKEKGVLNQCLAYFNLTQEQEKVLLNLELEHSGQE